MLKRLRVKFVAILMLVAACLLGVSFGLFYTLTRQNLRTQSISMMQAIAANPLEPVLPDAQPQQVRLPYFVLQMDKYGMITAINAGSFDLSDHAFLERIAQTALAGSETTGEIPEYNLRFCRVTASGVQSVIFADTTSERQTLRSLARTGAGIGAVPWRLCRGPVRPQRERLPLPGGLPGPAAGAGAVRTGILQRVGGHRVAAARSVQDRVL